MEKTKNELFDTFVGNIGYHCSQINQEMKRFRASAVHDMPMVEFRIEPRGDSPDVWDQCYQVYPDGTEEWLGNRCAAVTRYCEMASEALRTWSGVSE